MKFQLKSILCLIVLAAVSLGTAPQVQAAARPIAAGYSWNTRDQDRRTVSFWCTKHRDGSIGGFAEFDYTDQPNTSMLITSQVSLQDGTLCMAGPIVDIGDPTYLGWTGFFGVRDRGGRGENVDQVTYMLIAPPEFSDVNLILDYLGGSIPEQQYQTIDGGNVKIW